MDNQPSSLFDPLQFLESGEVTGEMSTKFEPTPLGRYNFQIKNYTARKITPKDTTKQAFTVFEVDCNVGGDARTPDGRTIKEITGRDDNGARYKTFLDFTEGGGLALGTGQNVGLGRLRAAVGQNSPTLPWKFAMLKGQVFSAEVVHRQDEKNPERVYAELQNLMPPQ